MTLDEAKAALQHIRDISDDSEEAHAAEDELRAVFIAHVAETAEGDLAEMAMVISSTAQIKFSRWYA